MKNQRNVNADEGFFPARDGTNIFYRVWLRDGANGCLLIHGYGDHSDRYQELVDSISDLGYSFYAFDLRGQGRSEGKRVFANSLNDYVSDCFDFLKFLEKEKILDQKKKLVLLGHSLGGLIALRVVLKDEMKWKGLVLSSPCFKLFGISWSPALRFLVKKIARVSPGLIMTNLVRPKYLFRDPVRMEKYLKDPLVERRVTARLANEIVKGCEEEQCRNVRLDIPVLVLASGNERVVSLDETKRWFERLQAEKKQMIVYSNLYHEIFNETGERKPVNDLRAFLTERAGEIK